MVTKEFVTRSNQAVAEAWGKGNFELLNEIEAPDLIVHKFPLPVIKGLEAYRQHVIEMRQAFADMQFDFEEPVIEGDSYAVRFSIRCKHVGPSSVLPVPPTGKEIIMRGCAVVHVKNNKNTEFFEYDDMLGIMQQLGVIQTAGQK